MKTIEISLILTLIFIATYPVIAFNNTGKDSVINEQTIEELLNQNISTVSKYEQKVKDAPNSVSIITSEDIRNFGYKTVEEALISLSGFYIRDDRNYPYIGLRGFDRPSSYDANILLLINGHRTNDNVYNSLMLENMVGIDLSNVERIEVVRGPNSTLYGAGAVLGVINIITKKPINIDGLLLNGSYGTYNSKRVSLSYGKKFDNNLDVIIAPYWGETDGEDLFFKEFDDSLHNFGKTKGLDWEKYRGTYVYASFDDFMLQGSYTFRNKGIPTASYETVFNDNRAWTLDESSFLELKYKKSLSSDKNVSVRVFYNYYYYTGSYPYMDFLQKDADHGLGYGIESQFDWDLNESNRLILGGEFDNNTRSDYELYNGDMLKYGGNYPYKFYGLFLQENYQMLSNLLFTFCLRYDDYSYSINSISPKIALVYNPFSSTSLKFLYGEAFRPPNNYELHYEDLISIEANTKLQPEKLKSFEFIIIQELNKNCYFSASFYDYTFNSLIEEKIDPIDSLTQYQNISKANAMGLELEFNYRIHPVFDFYANYSFQNAKNSSTGQRLSNSPEHLVKAGISYKFCNNFLISYENRYESERITVNNNNTKPFFLADLNMILSGNNNLDNQYLKFLNYMSLSLKIRNLFNKYYEYPGGYEHIQEGIPQYGRTYTLEMTARF